MPEATEANSGSAEEIKIEPYQWWKHPSGIEVIIVGEGFIKPEDKMFNEKDWIPAVSYRNPSGNNPDAVFTRNRESFLKKFTRVSR